MLLYSLLVWGIKFDSFLGTEGYNHESVISALQENSYAFSLWNYVPETWMWNVHVGCVAISLLFTLGFCSRVTSVLAWFIAISYAIERGSLTLASTNCLLATMYLMLAPCGAHFSLDRLIRRHWGQRKAAPKSSLTTVATRLVQLHLCIIYLFAGVSKLQGESWWNGNALWNVLANYEYQSANLTFLANYRWFTDIAGPLTVFWEISFCFLIWNRWLRPWVLLMGLGMHLGIGAFLGMWTFGLMMSFCYLSFVPGKVMRRAELRLKLLLGSRRKNSGQTKEDQLVGSTKFNDPTDEAHKSPIGPTQASTERPKSTEPTIILVCPSHAMGMKLLKYFSKYPVRVYLVDGLLIAKSMLENIDATVIILGVRINHEDLAYWIHLLRETNPTTKFIFSSDQTIELKGCRCLPEQSTPRALRKAFEEQNSVCLKSMASSTPTKKTYSADTGGQDTNQAQSDRLDTNESTEDALNSEPLSEPDSPQSL